MARQSRYRWALQPLGNFDTSGLRWSQDRKPFTSGGLGAYNTKRVSLVERQNLTMRMSMRRFTRLTNAFSKKLEKLPAAVSLHFAHYNNVRIHKSLRVTPAMAANVNDRLWLLEELVERTSR